MGGNIDTPVPGDYDGDGKSDIAVYRPVRGPVRAAVNHRHVVDDGVGHRDDVPVPGDYDGDGKTDIAVFHPGNATGIRLSGLQTTSALLWGSPIDTPVLATMMATASRISRSTVQRPVCGRSATPAPIHERAVGRATDPLHDYDGDGRTDLAVGFGPRPESGISCIRRHAHPFSGAAPAIFRRRRNATDPGLPTSRSIVATPGTGSSVIGMAASPAHTCRKG